MTVCARGMYHNLFKEVQTDHDGKVQRGIGIVVRQFTGCRWRITVRSSGSRNTGKEKVNFLVYLFQLPLLGLVATCSFLPFSHSVPLSSWRERRTFLPVHRQLQFQKVEGWAAAGLEQGRGCRASSCTRLWCRGAGVAICMGLWGFRRWRDVEWWTRVACWRSKVVVGVELILTVEGRWRCEGTLAWKESLNKRLRLGGEAPCVHLIHWLWWWWMPSAH